MFSSPSPAVFGKPLPCARACATFFLLASAAAHAAPTGSPSPSPTPSPQAGASLETVTVSASALEQGSSGLGLAHTGQSGSRTGISNKDLPASLSQVDSQSWQERGDNRMADIIGRTVGMTPLSASGYSSLSFSARGFTGTNSVGIAEDGVRLNVAASTTPYPNDSWGYERVEVLRGPASILYGSGTVGGTVNIVRKQPSREAVREVLLGTGSHGNSQIGLGAAGPLGETLSYRVDAYGHYSHGERDLGRSSGGKFLSTLRFQPNADLRFELLADVSDQKPERYFGTPVVNGQIVEALRKSNYNTDDSVISIRDRRIRARTQWQINDAWQLYDEAYHFTAKRYWKNIEGYTYVPASNTINRYDYLEIGHDLEQMGNRLEGKWQGGAHKLVFGWEASKSIFVQGSNSPYGGSSVVDAYDPIRGQWSSPDAYFDRVRSQVVTHDFYVEDAWQASDKWLLLGGLRRDVNAVKRKDLVGSSDVDKSIGGTAWRLGATYHLDADTNLYAQIGQGHDPVSNLLGLSLANSKYKLTTARQLELGVKQSYGQGRGEWTAALYRIQKTDIITRDPVTPSISVQGGSQSSRGLELSNSWRLNNAWRLEANYALTDAKFDELIEAGGANRSGKRPSNTPRQTANLWAHYLGNSSWGPWQASLGARSVGSRYANNANTARTGGYTVWDASLSWQPRRSTVVRLSARNLGDKLYSYSAVSGGQVHVGDGRSLNIAAEWLF